MALSGEHGEFELLFTVPPSDVGPFLRKAAREGWQPWRLGVAHSAGDVRVVMRGDCYVLNTGEIRNRFGQARIDLRRFLGSLQGMAERLQTSR
jgi:hypothetical protein